MSDRRRAHARGGQPPSCPSVTTSRGRARWVRLARIVALAVVIAIGIVNLYWAVSGWTLSDATAYWNAGLRLRAGEPLYPSLTDVDASNVYRYAPWFAWLAVPVTFLPIEAAAVLWSAVLLSASGVALLPLVRALVHGVERRSGPLWIAIAASLKATPILFALVYLGRRQYWRAAMAAAATALLVAPALLYDLRGYVTDA